MRVTVNLTHDALEDVPAIGDQANDPVTDCLFGYLLVFGPTEATFADCCCIGLIHKILPPLGSVHLSQRGLR